MPFRPFSLKSIHVLKDLSSASLRRMESACEWMKFTGGQPIVHYRAKDRGVFFLVQGQAMALLEAAGGRTVEFGDIGEGRMFGELSAIDGLPTVMSIVARTDCTVARFSAPAFREFLDREPLLAHAVLRHLSGRIRSLTTRLFELSVLSVPARLQSELLRLALDGDIGGDVAVVHRLPTHTELANRIATAREVVSREISRLDRLGVVERRGSALRIPSLSRLEKLVQESLGEIQQPSPRRTHTIRREKASSRPIAGARPSGKAKTAKQPKPSRQRTAGGAKSVKKSPRR